MARKALKGIGAALAAAVIAAIGVVTTATPAAAAGCTGTGAVEISSFSFNPTTVARGQSSTATLVAQNCTNATVQVAGQWLGRFIGSGPDTPPGCPAFDPLVLPLTLPPLGQASSSVRYVALANCTATSLRVTTTLRSGATTLAQGTADLTITAAARTCSVAYRTQHEWAGGYVAAITITNVGTAPITNWILEFSFPGDQRIVSAWQATVTQSGQAVTARAVSYNATISPGGSVSLGYQGTWSTSNAPPTAFTVNGLPCATT